MILELGKLLLCQNKLNEHMEPGCYFQCQPCHSFHSQARLMIFYVYPIEEPNINTWKKKLQMILV
ncbi:hypothetical protein ES332_A10G279700v1 [Gossypium tomentosum]|uniref:Uncharacterized protein n=1 Tax=Gossypium tomentosum TaxID=34277 RepID=A0A5D2NYK3_GOSTO|nr:hypothetical protein ES332_A10G279700v1 [Gossypium tomentosum]